jgi:outer membrane scaffolding protein for murein synthesis (MipA/OmpV family)
MRAARLAFALAGAALACPALASPDAPQEPLWEAGIGVGGVYFPDYRGSSQSRGYLLPAPYFVYRGRFLQADRNGVRGVFVDNDRVDLNLSLGASLPVDSSRDNARAGMADLKATVEVGPSLEVKLWEAESGRARLELRMPVRGAITVESSPRFIGGQFYPHLNLDTTGSGNLEGWHLGLTAGPVFTNAAYNRYFYEVTPEDATPGRPAYTPGGGYAGAEFLAAFSKRFPRYWVGGFVRYDTLRGAAFEASPLVTSKNYFAAGIAISWIVGDSKERVPVTELGERKR